MEVSATEERGDRVVNYKKIVVTDVQDTLRFAAQNYDDGVLHNAN